MKIPPDKIQLVSKAVWNVGLRYKVLYIIVDVTLPGGGISYQAEAVGRGCEQGHCAWSEKLPGSI